MRHVESVENIFGREHENIKRIRSIVTMSSRTCGSRNTGFFSDVARPADWIRSACDTRDIEKSREAADGWNLLES